MSTRYELSGGLEVTRWWNRGAYRWTLHQETLDVNQVAELAALIDPTVFKALYDRAYAERWQTNSPD